MLVPKSRMILEVDRDTRARIEALRWEHKLDAMSDVLRALLNIGFAEYDRNPRPLLAEPKNKGGRTIANSR